jgi:hypothetical protein
MHCPCGIAKVLAKGLCSTCYTLRRQDEEYFGGHREAVLKRDEYRCRARVDDCEARKALDRGTSQGSGEQRPCEDADAVLAVSCKGDAHVLRPRRLAGVLASLWREQHPEGHEQSTLDFATTEPQAKNVLLFKEMGDLPAARRTRRPKHSVFLRRYAH